MQLGPEMSSCSLRSGSGCDAATRRRGKGAGRLSQSSQKRGPHGQTRRSDGLAGSRAASEKKNDASERPGASGHRFGPELTHEYLSRRVARGLRFKATSLSPEFEFDAFLEHYGDETLPLALKTKDGALRFFTSKDPPKPQAGDEIIALVRLSKDADSDSSADTGNEEEVPDES